MAPTLISNLDVVALLTDLPEQGLVRGQGRSSRAPSACAARSRYCSPDGSTLSSWSLALLVIASRHIDGEFVVGGQR